MSKAKKVEKPSGGTDIRSFFGGKKFGPANGSKAEKRAAESPIDLTEDAPPSSTKKQKTGANSAPAEKAIKPSPAKKATPKKATPKKVTPKKAAEKKETKGKAQGGSKKRGRVVDSEDEDEYEEEAADSSESDDDLEIEVAADSDDDDQEEVMPAKKDRGAKKTPAARGNDRPSAGKSSKDSSATQTKAVPANPVKAPQPKKAAPKSTPGRKLPGSTLVSQTKAAAKKPAKEQVPEDVKKAIAAVDAAARKLPHIKIDLMAEENFGMGGGADQEPANPGSKEVPRGHPDCLTGKTFVLTGVLDSLWRHEAEDLIKRHAGKITGSVSGRTSFLVVGAQAGKSKTAQATAKETQMISEDGLIALIKAAPEPASKAEPMDIDDDDDDVMIVNENSAPGKSQALKSALNKAPTSSRAGPSQFRASGAAKDDPASGQLWVRKWRPKTSKDLVGNNTVIANLEQWLRNWEGVHLRGEEAGAQKGRGKPKDLGKKAVLLSGPPGIGKTSSATIITKELGYLPIEVNASDTRNKADTKITGGIGGKLANSVKELCTNTAIGQDEQGRKKRICLIMDEVDGMSGGDRGGVSELINIIKASKVPVICICNEKYNQKLKSLRNSVLELDFRKPTADQITKRAALICKAEGLSVNDTTLNTVAAGANGDIRLVLGQLQMIRLRSRTLSYDDAKTKLGTTKDADMSPFEAGRKLLSMETQRMSLGERTELVFQDMDLVPLLIQENYLNHRPQLAGHDERVRMSMIAKAADAFSMGDLVNRAVRQHQSWSLMPFAATVGSVLPACYMRGGRESFYGEMNFPRFTSWLGHNSSYGKQRRLLGELHTRMCASGRSTVDRTGMRRDYLPTLRKTLTAPLVQSEKEGIEDVVEQMQDYCLNKDDHQFILDVTQFKSKLPQLEDPYKAVPTATKSAFTRALNQSISHTKAKSTIMIEEFKRGGRLRKKSAAPVDDYDEDLAGDPELEAAAKAERAKQTQQTQDSDDEEEDEWTPKDAAAMAKKEKLLGKRGIVFQSKIGASAKGSGKVSRGKASGRGRGRGKGK